MGAELKGRGGRRKGRYEPMSQINVTPFVDVMLVLLIIFMVAAPLLSTGVKVDLPQTKSKPLSEEDKPLSVSLAGDGKLFINDTEVEINSLTERLRAIAEGSTETRIFVRADQGLPYGQVMEVMSTINAAGFNKVALVTTPAKGGKGK
ncbi:protein TolR [Iodidimonas sp. SYSU 1G8]|uniref:protein TolR n=1 Tax=Iodidimonas sp. SYSU 1G8 TaxID=3133967 RepID=UPI0031FEE186